MAGVDVKDGIIVTVSENIVFMSLVTAIFAP